MAEERLYQPTLVIGLGGTGKNIILALKKMIAENSPHGMSDFPFIQVLEFDTDIAVPRVQSSIKALDDKALELDPTRETVSLGADFSGTPNLADYPEIKEWFPPSLIHKLNSAELKRGAGQKKPIGRFSFAWNASNIYEKLHARLSSPIVIGPGSKVGNLSTFTNVFICGSICGGTSAGTFLDMAYMVRYIAKSIPGRTFYTYGMLASATLFEGIMGDIQIKPNCYASLVELDYFMNKNNYSNESRAFYPAYKHFDRDYKSSSNDKPFDFPFIFDRTNESGFSFSTPAGFGEMVARFIVLLSGHEVTKEWESMDNNVRAGMGDLDIDGKPILYRSMGAFSVLFPKRMILQLCGYKMTTEYLRLMLDNSYGPSEIHNQALAFLTNTKVNPSDDQLEQRFNRYRADATDVDFTSFLEEQMNSMLMDNIDKKELVKNLMTWKEDMDKRIGEFRLVNAATPRTVRGEVLDALARQREEWLDLRVRKDLANKSAQGEPLSTRGSVRRLNRVLGDLVSTLTEATDRYRKKEDESRSLLSDAKANIDKALSDLEAAVKSLIPNEKKIRSLKEEVLAAMLDHLHAQRMALISKGIVEVFTGIMENGVIRHEGVIKELEAQEKQTGKIVAEFETLTKAAGEYLDRNRQYQPGMLTDVIFSYEDDVIGSFERLKKSTDDDPSRAEDRIFGDLGDGLVQAFGPGLTKLTQLSAEHILKEILSHSEKQFEPVIDQISIEDKILASPDHLTRLTNKNYMMSASAFIGLDRSELGRIKTNIEATKFFAVTIPDSYTGLACSHIKGLVGTQKCPMEDEKIAREKPCGKKRCLKRELLTNLANEKMLIVPTNEKSEINILTTVAGFPLHAVTSLTHNCRPIYRDLVEKNRAESSRLGYDEDTLHMFGPIHMDDLTEPSKNPSGMLGEFRLLLLKAMCVQRLKILPAAVTFVTMMDSDLGRWDKPSMAMGKDLTEVLRRFQSSRVDDVKTFKIFHEDMESVLKEATSPAKKDRFWELSKKTYDEISEKMPPGLGVDDLRLLNEFGQETFGKPFAELKKDAGNGPGI